MSLQFARRAPEKILEGQADERVPVDVQKIAQRLRVPIVKDDLEADVSGLLITNAGKATIFVNAKDKPYRQRFSIAHELGHWVLKHHQSDGHVHIDKGVRVLQRGLKSSQGVDPTEIEANQFAASLLMPAKLVRREVERIGPPPLNEVMVEQLAEKFDVSVQAMTIRLNSLGHI